MDDSTRLAYRPAEAAELLGIGRSKVYAMLQRGELPVIRLGGCIRIPSDALRGWITRQLETSEVR